MRDETTRVEVVKPQAWKLALGLSGKKRVKMIRSG